MSENEAFIKKLESLTFGFGNKPPAVKKVKLKCGCGETHEGYAVAVPAPLAAVITGALSQAGVIPPPAKKNTDEQSFAA